MPKNIPNQEIYHSSPQNSADMAMRVTQEVMRSNKQYCEIIALANGMLLATVLRAQLDIPVQTFRVNNDFRNGDRVVPAIMPLHKDGSKGRNRLITIDVLRSTEDLILVAGEFPEADTAALFALEKVADEADFVGTVTDLADVQMWYSPWPPVSDITS
jgi:hypothetical protein